MSDIILKIISSIPPFMPSADQIDNSVVLLKEAFPSADEIYFSVSDDVEFIDAGTNWGKINCPNCDREIDNAWWQEAMERAYENRFTDLELDTPCCGIRSSLALLGYEWAVGFARFVLSIRNPKDEMSEQAKNSLEIILGTNVLLIWSLY